MREIKFRAWDSVAKSMSPMFSLFGEFTLLGGVHDWQKEVRGSSLLPYLTALNDLKTMQYTGLKDKNGKEIYEGDVIKKVLNKHYWLYEIKSIGGQFGVTLFAMCFENNVSVDEASERYTYKRQKESSRNHIKSGKGVEVIGNIYENPELLEAK